MEKKFEISRTIKNPQVCQKVEIYIKDYGGGVQNFWVKIIKIRKNHDTERCRYEYLCELENLERRWYSFACIVWPKR